LSYIFAVVKQLTPILYVLFRVMEERVGLLVIDFRRSLQTPKTFPGPAM
jgi:hypothetical protein